MWEFLGQLLSPLLGSLVSRGVNALLPAPEQTLRVVQQPMPQIQQPPAPAPQRAPELPWAQIEAPPAMQPAPAPSTAASAPVVEPTPGVSGAGSATRTGLQSGPLMGGAPSQQTNFIPSTERRVSTGFSTLNRPQQARPASTGGV